MITKNNNHNKNNFAAFVTDFEKLNLRISGRMN